jgi:hypothetical protein
MNLEILEMNLEILEMNLEILEMNLEILKIYISGRINSVHQLLESIQLHHVIT